MTRLRPISGKNLVILLKKRGWKLKRIRGSHYIIAKFDSIIAVPCHSNKDLPPGTLRGILKDAKISLEEYEKL
jgi:predicted RNA binding protein YcfA (HicA-like mRNA interferase family)